MPRYQLKDRCLFVDAKHHEKNARHPIEIPFAHVMDKRTKDVTYLKLNDAAGFIARFIVQGVDTALISQILRSEYGTKVKDPDAEVKAVVELLDPYLMPREYHRPYQAPKDHGVAKHSGKYSLNFRVNWFPIGGYKVPL
jgi:hypothetical protein